MTCSDFVRARLSAEGRFGLHLTIGGVLFIAGAWLFGGVAEDLITGDPLTIFDVVISDWFEHHATPSFALWMTRVSNLASPAAVLGLCILASLVLIWKHRWYALLALLLAVPGGIGLNLLLKMMFARARPGWAHLDLWGYSFPSGHTMAATLVYGFLGVCFVLLTSSFFQRTCATAIVLLIIGAVGFSRIYLGAHYFSDVVAAFAAGLAWLAICLTAVESLRRHRRVTPEQSLMT